MRNKISIKYIVFHSVVGYNDEPSLKGKRLNTCFFFFRMFMRDNYYAHPLDFWARKELPNIEYTEYRIIY